MPIKLEYRYDSGDVDEAFRAVRSRTWGKTRLRVGTVSAAFLICAWILFWIDPHSPILYLLVGVYLGVILLAIVAWQKTKKQSRGICKSYPIMQYKFTTEIDADGIKSTCDIATSLRRWECFTGYFESANLFHIQEGSRVLWIPKRAFAGEAEINQMRELLRSKLNCTTA